MSFKNKQQGQGIVEYVLLTAFVSLAAIAIFKVFRQDLSDAYKKAGQALVEGVSSTTSESSSE